MLLLFRVVSQRLLFDFVLDLSWTPAFGVAYIYQARFLSSFFSFLEMVNRTRSAHFVLAMALTAWAFIF